MQDLVGWKDDHTEEDFKESQRSSGQDAPDRPNKMEILHIFMNQLPLMTVCVASRHCRCRITTLKLCDLSFEENRDFVGEKGRKIFVEREKGRKFCRSAGRSPRVVRRSDHGHPIHSQKKKIHGSSEKCLRDCFRTPVEGKRDKWSG